jgi:hypothetical protein
MSRQILIDHLESLGGPLCLQAADEIRRIESKNKWIKCSERMPENKKQVLLGWYGQFGDWVHFIGCNTSGVWYFQGSYQGATHWMPLPAPPKDEP